MIIKSFGATRKSRIERKERIMSFSMLVLDANIFIRAVLGDRIHIYFETAAVR